MGDEETQETTEDVASEENQTSEPQANKEGTSNEEDSTEEYTEQEIYEGYDEDALAEILDQQSMVIDRYVDVINDIDSKAAYTLRLNVLLFSLVLGIISLSTSEQFSLLSSLSTLALYVGAGASLLSVVASLIAYTRTNIHAGLSSEDVDSLLEEPMGRKILLYSLVKGHQEWVRENSRANKNDANIVFGAHMLLLVSMFNFALAVAWMIYPSLQSFTYQWLQVIIVSVIAVGFLAIPYILLSHYDVDIKIPFLF